MSKRQIFKIAILTVFSITLFACRKDEVPSPPPVVPIDYTTYPYQDTYTGQEQYLVTTGPPIEDTTYQRSYTLFLNPPDTTHRIIHFLSGVMDSVAIPVDSLNSGSFHYYLHSSNLIVPEYVPYAETYSTHFDLQLTGDSLYFHLEDIRGSDYNHHYYFSGAKQ